MNTTNRQRIILLFSVLYLFFLCSCKKQYTTEDIRYNNGDISIAARIYKPVKGNSFPAVVIMPSAEPDTRETYKDYAEYFAAHGIVTICYDKRGSGETNGNIWQADFYELFDDAYSGIEYLKKLPFVDTSKMGFLGHSQGGMYIFLSDSLVHDVAFVIDIAGSPSTPLSQSHYNIKSKITENGGSPQYADSLAYLMDDYIQYLFLRNNYNSIRSRYETVMADHEKPVADKIDYFGQFKYLLPPDQLPPFDEMEMYPFMRSCNFEPGKFYPSLTIPALVVYGCRIT